MIFRCLRRRTYSSSAALTAFFLVRWRPSFWASAIRRSSKARLVGIPRPVYPSECVDSSVARRYLRFEAEADGYGDARGNGLAVQGGGFVSVLLDGFDS